MPWKNNQWQPPSKRDLDSYKGTGHHQEVHPVPANILDKLKTRLEGTLDAEESKPSLHINGVKALFESSTRPQVDIVIPVHDGLHVLKQCIDSVVKRTHFPYTLTIINDASPDEAVEEYLKKLPSIIPSSIPLWIEENEHNLGFAASVNRGIKAGRAKYICLLNSDVIVTDYWLTKMVLAMEDNPINQIVNPMTNNTALTGIEMYPGMSYLDMNDLMEDSNVGYYPEIMPTGFCFMFRRSLVDEIGYFEEDYGSYGEETEYWFKTLHRNVEGYVTKGRAVMDASTYVFHERGSSFTALGDREHTSQRLHGSQLFHTRNPKYKEWKKSFGDQITKVSKKLNNVPCQLNKADISFIVNNAEPSGGMLFVKDVANYLIEQGETVRIYCLKKRNEIYPIDLRTAPVFYKDSDELINGVVEGTKEDGIIFFTTVGLIDVALELRNRNPEFNIINFIQDYTPDLILQSEGSEDLAEEAARAYNQFPAFVMSKWIANKLIEQQVPHEMFLPGIDADLFHTREETDERFGVLFYTDHRYVFKNYHETIKCIEACDNILSKRFDYKSYVVGRGEWPSTKELSQARLARLLGSNIKVVVDLSLSHSYGMPALEGLMSGCAVIVHKDNIGIEAYEDAFESRIHKVATAEEATAKILELFDSGVLKKYDSHYKDFISRHSLSRTDRIKEMYGVIKEFKYFNKLDTKIQVITPHLRTYGGPVSIAKTAEILAEVADTELASCYTDFNPLIADTLKVPLRPDWRTIKEVPDITIINSDNPYAAAIMDERRGSKFIMLKLSHNERFHAIENDNLNLHWDHIITSTEWLRKACLKPLNETWTHKLWNEDQVTRVGWYHFDHPIFNKEPEKRGYGTIETELNISTLIHNHPLKGSMTAMAAYKGLKNKYNSGYNNFIKFWGVGESQIKIPGWLNYVYCPPRKELAAHMQGLDIWLGASYTEGLGRMSLEAMSAGAAVVASDTRAEFLEHEENCLLFEPGNSQQAAEQVDRLIKDRDLFTKIIMNGYETAKAKSDPTEFKTNLKAVIEKVLN